MKGKYNAIDWIALILIIIGAINWGLVGAFSFNLVESIFGTLADSVVTMIIYIVVGLAGLWSIYTISK